MKAFSERSSSLLQKCPVTTRACLVWEKTEWSGSHWPPPLGEAGVRQMPAKHWGVWTRVHSLGEAFGLGLGSAHKGHCRLSVQWQFCLGPPASGLTFQKGSGVLKAPKAASHQSHFSFVFSPLIRIRAAACRSDPA